MTEVHYYSSLKFLGIIIVNYKVTADNKVYNDDAAYDDWIWFSR